MCGGGSSLSQEVNSEDRERDNKIILNGILGKAFVWMRNGRNGARIFNVSHFET